MSTDGMSAVPAAMAESVMQSSPVDLLVAAIKSGNVPACKSMIIQFPDAAHGRDSQDGASPAHWAALFGHLEVLQALVEQGNTVIVIEHNLEVIKTADHIIDLGPEGGGGGGRIVAQGTPETVARVAESHTGHYLAQHLPGLRIAETRKSA